MFHGLPSNNHSTEGALQHGRKGLREEHHYMRRRRPLRGVGDRGYSGTIPRVINAPRAPKQMWGRDWYEDSYKMEHFQ